METSCRLGAVALGRGANLLATRSLGPTGRHAAELLAGLDELLQEHGLAPTEIGELYVSAGPGSFTGLRVGITVARTWAQFAPGLKTIAVPTPLAVAEQAAGHPWEHLGVLLAAKRVGRSGPTVHGTLVRRDAQGHVDLQGEARLAAPEALIADWPRPLVLTGEGVGYCDLPTTDDVAVLPEDMRMPTAEAVWRIGRRLAERGEFDPWAQLQPMYARRPEAIRLWEQRHGRV